MYNNFDCLIDKKVFSFSISDDRTEITIKTENSTIILTAEGDCCSESWIEHFDLIPEGSIIKKVIQKDTNVIQEAVDFEYEIEQYFYEFVTETGSFTIELRNSSNGYYGGFFYVKEIKNN